MERVAGVPQHDGHPTQRQALSVHLLRQPQAQQEGQSSFPYHNEQSNVFINLLSNYEWQKNVFSLRHTKYLTYFYVYSCRGFN